MPSIVYVIHTQKTKKRGCKMIVELTLAATPRTAKETFKNTRSDYTPEMAAYIMAAAA